jgi:hypothetical protein
MKKHILTLLVLGIQMSLYKNVAQTNLVFNPGFESYTACPAGGGYDIQNANGWNHARGSCDYFNTCATSAVQQVPFNYFGYQMPANGNAYAGIVNYSSNFFYREIIIGQLTAPLVIGQKYFCSYKTSRADNNSNSVNGFSVNKAGFKLSKFTYTNVPINNSATYFNSSVITDTVNWTRIASSFVADSAYQYIMIGNFFNDINTTIVADGNGSSSYYYIDDVCLSTDSTLCTLSTGINTKETVGLLIYPNPASDYIYIKQPFEDFILSYSIFNNDGSLIIENTPLTSGKIEIKLLPSGFYVIKITTVDSYYYEKFVINR